MTTLQVVVDQIVAPKPGGIGRYSEELTRAIIATAPEGCDVVGIVAASAAEDQDRLTTLLPGIAELAVMPVPRRELAAMWRMGVTAIPGTRMSGKGMVHAPSLLAPLRSHDRLNEVGTQTVVTIHDVVPWTHPETLTRNDVWWHKAMAKRAHRFADAVVGPTHAVAGKLN
jgi:hypothetical protein